MEELRSARNQPSSRTKYRFKYSQAGFW